MTREQAISDSDLSGKITLEDTSTHASITASDKNEIEIKGVHIEAGKPINVTAETILMQALAKKLKCKITTLLKNFMMI